MRTRSLILLLLLVPLSGCVVTYRDFPNATLESLPKDHELKPLYYHVEPIITHEVGLGVGNEQRGMGRGVSRVLAGMYSSILSGLYGVIPQVDPIGEPGYHQVAHALKASGMFSDLNLIDPPTVPDRGVYCYVNFEVRDRSDWISGYVNVQIGAGIVTLGILMPAVLVNALPHYAGEGGTTVVYTLYRDGQLTQTYRYPITKKAAGWIVLLPFAWLNFFTNDLKDAVRGATLQFLIDAHRDGHL